MKKISLYDIQTDVPDWCGSVKSKDKLTLEWLIQWVESGLKSGVITYGDLLPSKKEIAQYLGVSTGTVQNAIRYAEDMGYFISKQCVGTQIKDPKINTENNKKMTSKKDKAVIDIKKYIIKNNLKCGDFLPSARIISYHINTSQNTVRLALDYLVQKEILEHSTLHGNKSSWMLKNKVELSDEEKHNILCSKKCTLSLKLKDDIKNYISKNYKTGDKILSNEEFAKMFNVSIRTVNDAMKDLNKEKVILSRRGQYGTIYINEPDKHMKEKTDKSLFMSAPKGQSNIKVSYMYSWERILDQLKKYMISNNEAGDKIPSMKELADILNVSTNTIRRAVKELVKEGILYTQRGKYGGVYIVEMPVKENAYTWLSLNPEFILKN